MNTHTDIQLFYYYISQLLTLTPATPSKPPDHIKYTYYLHDSLI